MIEFEFELEKDFFRVLLFLLSCYIILKNFLTITQGRMCERMRISLDKLAICL